MGPSTEVRNGELNFIYKLSENRIMYAQSKIQNTHCFKKIQNTHTLVWLYKPTYFCKFSYHVMTI
jgi:hypothetical protein